MASLRGGDLDDAAVDRIRAILEGHSGMSLVGARRADLLRVLAAVGEEERLRDLGELERALARPVSGPGLRDRLVARLTVPESSFFRDSAQIEALERHILPELLADAGAARPVVIWSAGCSTGEEPYTLAILLDRIAPGSDGRRARIVATDINPKSLEHAGHGLYSDWSLRQTPQEVRDAYFEKKGRMHELAPRIRSRVTFARENLEGAEGGIVGPGEADLILCRNVMIYLRTDACERLAGRFHRALRRGGWLVVAPAELSSEVFRDFAVVPFPGAYLYRKDPAHPQPLARTREAAPPAPSPIPVAARQGGGGLPAAGAGIDLRSAEDVRALLLRAPEEAPGLIAREVTRHPDLPIATWAAEALSASGRFEEARPWAERAIAADPVSAALHHRLGMILAELGDFDGATAAFRRCLYADPASLVGHFHLAELLHRAGNDTRARAARESLRRLLAGRPADEPVPGGDGLSVGQLQRWLDVGSKP